MRRPSDAVGMSAGDPAIGVGGRGGRQLLQVAAMGAVCISGGCQAAGAMSQGRWLPVVALVLEPRLAVGFSRPSVRAARW